MYVNVCKSGKKYTSVFDPKARAPVYFCPTAHKQIRSGIISFFFFNLIIFFLFFFKDFGCRNIVRRA